MGDAWVVASETCAFDIIGAECVRSVEPGELIIINDKGLQSERFAPACGLVRCARWNMSILHVLIRILMALIFTRHGNVAANSLHVKCILKRMSSQVCRIQVFQRLLDFLKKVEFRMSLGLIKSRYVGRTFIQPSQELREQGVKMKLSPVRQVVKGKRVVMVDDSIVRGTTSKRIVRMLKEAGATEVHVVIASPPLVSPCFYGVDISTDSELIATNRSVDEIRELIEADSLTFLSAGRNA